MRPRWSRRAFLQSMAACPLAAPAVGQAQPVRIGVVFYRVRPDQLAGPTPFFLVTALRDGMRHLGWREGRDIAFEWRTADGNDEEVPAIVAELLRSGVHLLALSGNNIVEGAMRLTRTVPIVMLASTSPVESGLVATLSRPGGNITGVAQLSQPELVGKRFELLKEAAPRTTAVALLHDGITRELDAARAQGRRVGVKVVPYAVDTTLQLHDAMRDARQRRCDAVSVETSYAIAPAVHREIKGIVMQYRLPMIHRFREAVVSGHALMSYAPDPLDDYRRASAIIDRILKGAKPGEIPVEVANRFYLDVNVKLADSIGWKIPAAVIARADTVI
jgi:putative ABC transport system substrate-binding protein